MGLTKTAVVVPIMLSPLGKACERMDLTAVHDILLKTGYKDEEGADNEVHLTFPRLLIVIIQVKQFGKIRVVFALSMISTLNSSLQKTSY